MYKPDSALLADHGRAFHEKTGLPDRDRTCDPQLRRLMLYPTELRTDIKKAHKVSFFICFWSEYKDSNLGPPGPKPGALPDCATLRQVYYYSVNFRPLKSASAGISQL